MKAIIPAAGHGTRFLPITKVVPKEMLPIGSKPALELIIEEAKRAGVDEITLVISRGKELIRQYFAGDESIRFVYQEEQRGLGHAVLVGLEALALSADDSQVLVLLGDALVAGCDASSEMLGFSRAHGGVSVIGCEQVPRERVSRYGVLEIADGRITGMVEKPSVEDAPSNLVIAGRYLLDVRVADYLRTQEPGKGGEIQLTDAIRRMLADGATVLAYEYPGHRQDIGNPKGYLNALVAMGANE